MRDSNKFLRCLCQIDWMFLIQVLLFRTHLCSDIQYLFANDLLHPLLDCILLIVRELLKAKQLSVFYHYYVFEQKSFIPAFVRRVIDGFN